MKRSILSRLFSLLLCAAAILAALCSCTEGKSQSVSINNEALEYFNKGISAFNVSKCLSITRGYAVLSNDADPDSSVGYLLYMENFYDNNGAASARKTVTRHGLTKDPKNVLASELPPVSTAYLQNDWVYYAEDGGKKFKVPLENDYANGLGLYSLGNITPGMQYGIIDEGVVRVDLYFSANQCKKSQQVFIENMNAVLLKGYDPEVTYSGLTVSSYMDEKTGRFTSYDITFTGKCTVNGRNLTLRYTYSEQFFPCNAKNEIDFPADLSSYETLKNTEKQ
jgi:hypothetical protein